MSNLLQEAIADANRVKEIAYENAKSAIAEAFQPRIQRMISSRLAEDDFDPEADDKMGGDPFMMGDDPMAGDPAAQDFGQEEEDPFNEEKYIDDGEDGTPASNPGKMEEQEFDAKFEGLIKELEADLAATDGMAPDEQEPVEDMTIEALARGLMEKDGYDDDCGDSGKNTGKVEMAEVKRLRNIVSRLTRENKDALRAISTLKSAMNEVNLLNAKLMFSSKIIQRFDLTESQQVKVLETFDRAQSIREARLIFETISGNYQNRSKQRGVQSNKPTPRTRPVNESASRPIRAIKRAPLNEEYGFADRWKVLAGLRDING